MKVSVSKSKNQTIYYLSKSVWINGKSTTAKEFELAVFYIEIRFPKANERGYRANADKLF